MWLLSDEEINKLMEAADDLDVDWPPLVARAQLKKVLDKFDDMDNRQRPRAELGWLVTDPEAWEALISETTNRRRNED